MPKCKHVDGALVYPLQSGRWAIRCDTCNKEASTDEKHAPAWARKYIDSAKNEMVKEERLAKDCGIIDFTTPSEVFHLVPTEEKK